MSNITPEARYAYNQILRITAQLNNNIDPTKTFNVSPRVAQTTENVVMQSNAFLKRITNTAVREKGGDILHSGVPRTITKRTRTPDQYGVLRRPSNPTHWSDRSYYCNESEQDSVITWDEIDMWAHLPGFYQKFRDRVTFAQARDRLLVSWWGQDDTSGDTDPALYDRLQDMHKGFFQFMIEENPSNVLGLNADGTIKPIKIDPFAPDADFKTIDQLAYFLRYEILHELYQERNGLRMILGNSLVNYENAALLGSDQQQKPTERTAMKLYLNSQEFGQTKRIKSDEFPHHALFLTEPSNLARYWQRNSFRRKLSENDHEHKGIVSYNFVREDYVVSEAEGAACVHPDAIQFKNEKGEWESPNYATRENPDRTTWAIEKPELAANENTAEIQQAA